jgi:hypothetical protein
MHRLLICNLEKSTIALVSFVLAWVAAQFVGLRFDVDGFLWDAFSVLCAFTVALITGRSWKERAVVFSASLISAIPIFLGFGLVLVTYWAGYALPAHDPIAVPTLAHVVIEGSLPLEVYPPGTSAHSYPPGQPIIISALAWLSPIDRIFSLKIMGLLAVALTPSAWAWLHYRLFPDVKCTPFRPDTGISRRA